MLGTDKSRGYCLEMICADFLVGNSDCNNVTLGRDRLNGVLAGHWRSSGRIANDKFWINLYLRHIVVATVDPVE